MAGCWRFVAVALLAGVFCPALFAHRTSQAMNYNTHQGKFATGGFGIDLFMAMPLQGELYRGKLVSTANGTFIGNNGLNSIDRGEFTKGIGFDLQFGSNNDIVGTDVGLDIISYSVDSNGVNLFSATDFNLGFNFVINFYKSEFIEADGRRTRDDFNLSLLTGLQMHMLMGDLEDINGFAAAGMELGLAADFPVYKDLFQIAPAMWIEMNYHMSEDVQVDIFDLTRSNRTGPIDPTNPLTFDGVVVRQHTLIPSFLFNLGTDFVLTPLFVGKQGNLINKWRFNVGIYFNVPFAFNAFAADGPGAPLKTDNDGQTYATFTFGAAYFW